MGSWTGWVKQLLLLAQQSETLVTERPVTARLPFVVKATRQFESVVTRMRTFVGQVTWRAE
jgi:hypothetical protein